ncbi:MULTISPECIES: glycosyltransferase family 39 protein [Bradyrhizobium]|jgi:4-amino-4-deoxy-L-arabinose transferase-like glycosyltransferase|uniref:4-amino-4-deoxy-L-arabinose transferase-like glycosyltransferase n=2 Tax=Nitrobacteraceae TaxID=41294 RepID=A0ABV4G1M1_9BRAD|nr:MULTISPECIES: glycosyltransferase family 39 protein [Bradyrhizobium]MBR1294284.1 glycosyltransferase family 39 protein [Bradyrhizobium ottawaense]MBR1362722.1 glycosyltransferase family 39 protein [Bradyrhizobium ottawaense]MDA9415950.1 membrane protein [Bradyrhizobium sp. CCBAU 25360]MDA9486782.1 membrane protein [Bradyrhizobium sp. CCBAU 11445]WLB43552.1 glycosyltransferase family 39 protein [Bradyrhizobium ottawaense]
MRRPYASLSLLNLIPVPIDFAFQAMAERSDRAPARWRRPFLHWLDGVEAGWAVPLLIGCFVAIWTLYLAIAYAGGGLHPDTLEAWMLGQHFAWGYHKHPPLTGWIAASWTSVFPLSDWSLQLMAMANAGLALIFVDRIARQFVTGHKRILVLLLLMLTPVYQFHAQRFNANSVLLAVWPLATWCFLRAFETRAPLWAVAMGCTTALAMVGKYYSIFLVTSFAFAALAHPARRAYFTSASPWISVVVGLAALSPHVYWLATTGASTFTYALAHTGGNAATSLGEARNFLLGLAAAMSMSAVFWVLVAGTRLKRFPADFAAMGPGLRLLFYVTMGTIVLPVVTSLVMGTDLPSLWALQGLFLFTVLVVCGTSYPIERFYTVNLTVIVAGVALAAVLIAAPIHAVYRNDHGYEEGRNLYAQAASELTREWREQTGVPLSAVSGDGSLAFASAFYSPDHPRHAAPFEYEQTLGLPRKTSLDRGWAALCFRDQESCTRWMAWASSQTGHFVRREFTVRATLWGRPGLSREVVALIVRPRGMRMIPKSAADDFSASRRGSE